MADKVLDPESPKRKIEALHAIHRAICTLPPEKFYGAVQVIFFASHER